MAVSENFHGGGLVKVLVDSIHRHLHGLFSLKEHVSAAPRSNDIRIRGSDDDARSSVGGACAGRPIGIDIELNV